MGHKSIICWVFCLFPLIPFFTIAEESLLKTNGASGAYRLDQRFWFSAPTDERLFISLDGEEVFKGIGTASVLLSVPIGAERIFSVTAQRRSAPPENAILEEQTYLVHIDKETPAKPAVAFFTEDGKLFSASITCEAESVLQGAYSSEGSVRFIEKKEQISELTEDFSAPFSMILWAVDEAGNYSEPITFSEKPIDFTIISPETGIWNNPQPLIIENGNSGRLSWTDDGSDPFGDKAHVYEGPVPIQKTGSVALRIGLKLSAEIKMEKKISYQVNGQNNAAWNVPQSVTKSENIDLPGLTQWKIGEGPYMDGSLPIIVKPLSGFKRYIVLTVKKDTIQYRYPILLDGIQNSPQGDLRTGLTPDASGEDETITPEDTNQEPVPPNLPKPELLKAEPLWVLYWNNPKNGIIRYHKAGDNGWKDFSGPLFVPSEPFQIEWILDKGTVQEGPGRISFGQKMTDDRSKEKRIEYRSLSSAQKDFRLLELITEDFIPDFSACNGEDLEWRIVSADGKILFQKHTDALPPPAPELVAPKDGEWISGAVEIIASIPTIETDAKTIIEASLRYPSGKQEKRTAEKELVLNVPSESPVDVQINAYSVDSAGNKSPVTSRHFTIDSNSVYVNALGNPAGDGSRHNPIVSLGRALELAGSLERTSVRIEGPIVVDEPLVVSRGITIEGSTGDASGEILFRNKGQLIVSDGDVIIRRLHINIDTPKKETISIASSATLLLEAMELQGTAHTLVWCTGSLSVVNSHISINGSDITAMIVNKGKVRIDNSTVQLDANGSVLAIRAVQSHVAINNTVIKLDAGIFGSVFDMENGSFLQQGGLIEVSARDGILYQYKNMTEVYVSKIEALLVTAFVAQVCMAEGPIPHFNESVFYFRGRAKESSVFNFNQVLYETADYAGAITNNYFIGFSSLLKNKFASANVRAFNLMFAAPGKQNFIDEDP